MKQITLTISKDGKRTTIKDVTGFGQTCADVTKEFESRIGRVLSREDTASLYEPVPQEELHNSLG